MKADGAVTGGEGPDETRDDERDEIVRQEEQVLARVHRTLGQWRRTARGTLIDYDAELLALRDQIRDARAEDIPPLIEEMERLQQVANRRAQVTEGTVDPSSPYFGRLVLEENERRREVLIGRSTFVDPRTGIRIVDWRDAPVSRVYYRYDEGDDYEECFGDRDVEGEVITRRSLSISARELRRIACPQGTFARRPDLSWRRVADSAARLAGGQGAAMRPQDYHRPGVLGIGDADTREEKHLSEITALIDPT
ncbi:MAG: DNA helicase UvrD, partial [Polyangiaceae bacterium]|nr:DNA helicase UvrD [Polyangiaceae bacterium]